MKCRGDIAKPGDARARHPSAGPLRDEVVLVGGQVAELLITDAAAVRVRPTSDVDVICRGAVAAGLSAVEVVRGARTT